MITFCLYDVNGEKYYAGYTTKGPVLVDAEKDAYHFPSSMMAMNVHNGDERLKHFKVVECGSN